MSWIDPEEEVRRWHWTTDAPVVRVQVEDPDLPEELIWCGRWVAATVELLRGGIRTINCEDEDCHLAFDPASEGGRLYLVLSEDVLELSRGLWTEGGETLPLALLARQVGGTHTEGYPAVMVQAIGPLVQIEYYCRKYGNGQGADDGAVFYHPHERRPIPWLAVSEDGRLWYAGGSYDATDPRGIVG